MATKRETVGAYFCAVFAVVVYLHTISANFAFDDNFAVIFNGDVTNDDNPLRGLLVHDFWGQRISSDQSHKSYRPLTVLSFRLIRKAWSALPSSWRQHVMARRSLSLRPYEENEAGRRGLDPLLFHGANVVAHAAVSALVCKLSYFLLRRRWRPTRLLLFSKRRCVEPRARRRQRQSQQAPPPPQPRGPPAAAAARRRRSSSGSPPPESSPPPSSAPPSNGAIAALAHPQLSPSDSPGGGGGLRRRRGGGGGAPLPPQPPASSAAGASSPQAPPQPAASRSAADVDTDVAFDTARLHAPAWFSGLAFALHPVHTEAVAGVVGQAELLSAALSVPAVMLYVSAAETAAALRAAGGWNRTAAVRHWAAVAAAAALALAAALAKEIGITVLGCMLAADVLLVPLVVQLHDGQQTPPLSPGRQRQRSARGGTAGGGGDEEPAATSPSGWLARMGRLVVWAAVEEPKWLRMGLLVAVGVSYVRLRAWVAVDQLVRIYRKVENPIPFSPSPTVRLLSTAHLHARYWGLLLYPRHLSADWSFDCVPLVQSLNDPRNGLTAALYGYLLWVLLAAKPWGVMGTWRRAAAAASTAASTAPPATTAGPGPGASAALDAAAAAAGNGSVAALDGDVNGGGKVGDGGAGAAFGTEGGLVAAAESVEQRAAGGAAEERRDDREEVQGAERERRLWAARWRLLVLAGLVVGPFFPAANVLFYVGTFIGERLLYFPSVGYCLLLSELLSGVLSWGVTPPRCVGGRTATQQPRADAVAAGTTGSGGIAKAAHNGKATAAVSALRGAAVAPSEAEAVAAVAAATTASMYPAGASGRSGLGGGGVGGRRTARGSYVAGRAVRRAALALAYCFMVAVLVSYAVRTWIRNYDWSSEEALFEAANKVCPRSAKVQLNLGVLQRRRGDQAAALAHFRRARAIEPGYCEPGYWIGISLVNQGDPAAGVAELEAALGCKYVAAEAFKVLNTILKALRASRPDDPTPVLRWGLLLIRPEVLHTAEGCDTLEQAALMYAQRRELKEAENALQWCIQALDRPDGTGAGSPVSEVAAQVFGVGRPGSAADSTGGSPDRIRRCLLARAPVYRALATSPRPISPTVLAAMYTYVRQLDDMPYCRLGAASMSGDAEARIESSAPHMHLVHVVQTADAEDPWMQAEWGRTLKAVGRMQEAATHLSVAAVLLNRRLERLQQQRPPHPQQQQPHTAKPQDRGANYPRAASISTTTTTTASRVIAALGMGSEPDPSGVLLATRVGLEGIARALEEVAELRPAQLDPCQVWAQVAEARWLLAARAAGAMKEGAGGEEGTGEGARDGERARHLGALRAAVWAMEEQRCVTQLRALRGLGIGAGVQ